MVVGSVFCYMDLKCKSKIFKIKVAFLYSWLLVFSIGEDEKALDFLNGVAPAQ